MQLKPVFIRLLSFFEKLDEKEKSLLCEKQNKNKENIFQVAAHHGNQKTLEVIAEQMRAQRLYQMTNGSLDKIQCRIKYKDVNCCF